MAARQLFFYFAKSFSNGIIKTQQKGTPTPKPPLDFPICPDFYCTKDVKKNKPKKYIHYIANPLSLLYFPKWPTTDLHI